MKQLNILVQAHLNYSYMDATIVQGLRNLGHFVCGVNDNQANYLMPYEDRQWHLFIQCLCGAGPLRDSRFPNVPSIMVYGLDNHDKFFAELSRGFDHIFLRDYLGDYGDYHNTVHPMNFAIEDRYYAQAGLNSKQLKPLKDRPIDISFLGNLYPNRKRILDRLESDFKNKTLVFGGRLFNEPDAVWSKHTLPYCAHDPRYFDVLANSKICLSLVGAGPDCARHWEVMASGGIPLIELMPTRMVEPTPMTMWFDDYEELKENIQTLLIKPGACQPFVIESFVFNKTNHSTAARAQYVLDTIGLG